MPRHNFDCCSEAPYRAWYSRGSWGTAPTCWGKRAPPAAALLLPGARRAHVVCHLSSRPGGAADTRGACAELYALMSRHKKGRNRQTVTTQRLELSLLSTEMLPSVLAKLRDLQGASRTELPSTAVKTLPALVLHTKTPHGRLALAELQRVHSLKHAHLENQSCETRSSLSSSVRREPAARWARTGLCPHQHELLPVLGCAPRQHPLLSKPFSSLP